MSSTEIIRLIGTQKIAMALGVSDDAVREQGRAKDGLLPASWFSVVRRLSIDVGIEVAESAFRFKSAEPEQ